MAIETNRQRLERLGMMDDESIEKISAEERCGYCTWTREVGVPIQAGPNGPIMCEGRFCEEATERWLDDEATGDDEP